MGDRSPKDKQKKKAQHEKEVQQKHLSKVEKINKSVNKSAGTETPQESSGGSQDFKKVG